MHKNYCLGKMYMSLKTNGKKMLSKCYVDLPDAPMTPAR